MKKNNDFEKMIADKLNSLDQTPNDLIWDTIEAKLDKKKDRKLLYFSIPLLLKGILLGYLLTIFFSGTNDTHSPRKIEITKDNVNVDANSKTKNIISNDTITPRKTKIISTQKTIIKETSDAIIYEICNTYLVEKKFIVATDSINNSSLLTTNPISEKVVENTKSTTKKKIPNTNRNQKENQNESIKESKNITINDTNEQITSKEEKNVFDSISLVNPNKPTLITENTSKDSTALPIEKNQTKKTFNKKESQEEKKKKKQKKSNETFYVTAFYGPSIFGSLKNGSSINASFDSYEKSHPITATYGVYFRTMFSKIGFRAGISVQNLSYNTQLNDDNIRDYRNIELNNTITSSTLNASFTNNTAIQLKHRLTYYEIPLELYYDITDEDSKLGWAVFGGVIPQYLKNNSLLMSSNETQEMEIGKASNLSKVSIALDLGLGIHYKIADKIQLNVNPVLKYQTSSYKSKPNFNPYSLSIQTGVTYKIN